MDGTPIILLHCEARGGPISIYVSISEMSPVGARQPSCSPKTRRGGSRQGTSSSASFVEDVTAINRSFLRDQPIEQVTVTMRTLNTVLDTGLSPAPSLVKIDIEGFELEALT
jgi:hypothetical protein